MGTVKLGQRVKRWPETFGPEGKTNEPALLGKVVYIHPKGRFHTVEFQVGTDVIRESFIGIEE